MADLNSGLGEGSWSKQAGEEGKRRCCGWNAITPRVHVVPSLMERSGDCCLLFVTIGQSVRLRNAPRRSVASGDANAAQIGQRLAALQATHPQFPACREARDWHDAIVGQ
jgi:hypothetical protein